MPARFKSNKAIVADGLRPVRFRDGVMSVLVDMAAERYSEIYLDNGTVTPPPGPIDPPPPPPGPIDPPPPPSSDPVSAANAAALTAALNAAKGGEVIRLAAGNYGVFTFSGKSYASKVRIASDGSAKFAGIDLSGVNNLCFDGIVLDWFPFPTTVDHAAGFKAVNCNDLTLIRCKLRGNPVPVTNELVGRGISVQPGKNITIEKCDVSGFRRGILTSDIDGLILRRNWVHDNRTTTLSGGDVRNAVIEGNHLSDSYPQNFGGAGDHGDYIHYWAQAVQDGASRNFVIRDNFMEQGGGTALLGIYLDNNDEVHGFADVLIENNVLHNGNGQGIRLEDVKGAIVRNNTLLQSKGDYHTAPRIRVEDGCRDVSLVNNIVANTTTGKGNIAANGITETGTVVIAAVSGQAGKFVGLPTDNGTLADMQQIPGAFPAGVGATLTPDMVY